MPKPLLPSHPGNGGMPLREPQPKRAGLPQLIGLLLLLIAAGAAVAQIAPATLTGPRGEAAFRATVVAVGDGDSLRVRREGEDSRPIRVRLACIDAPELQQRPWGAASRAALQTRLPPGRSVLVLPHDRDRYGRTVAEVISELNINLVMVEDGQAFVYRRHLGPCDGREYLQAEFRASRHRYGVWQVPGGITRPWAFRQTLRAAEQQEAGASSPDHSGSGRGQQGDPQPSGGDQPGR